MSEKLIFIILVADAITVHFVKAAGTRAVPSRWFLVVRSPYYHLITAAAAAIMFSKRMEL